MDKIKAAVEYFADDDFPIVENNTIKNLLVLGNMSRNAWNATANQQGDGPRRNFTKIIATENEIFNNKPSFLLHKVDHDGNPILPRDPGETLGQFSNPHASPKGLRMDLKCIENDQTRALLDNVKHKRPFGGFSPCFDLSVDCSTGMVEKVDAVYSIDLVPNPGTVRSAVEEEVVETIEPNKEENKIEERINTIEEKIQQMSINTIRTDPPPVSQVVPKQEEEINLFKRIRQI